ncbi:hypothetical protein DPMN_027238 [Dreissena polymorpha]|uniref:Paraneoplastic antigen Ma-like C-terminal domain-containing protein n=1 Tax=Dreissena polymorpha TaxID=45954 RepID=A0A9D4LUW5_DREPO|nr:hypothetical protein DPMN_027238 [Dreissena polymorpha]
MDELRSTTPIQRIKDMKTETGSTHKDDAELEDMRKRVEKLKGMKEEIEQSHARRKQEQDDSLRIRQEEMRKLREQEHQLMQNIQQHEETFSSLNEAKPKTDVERLKDVHQPMNNENKEIFKGKYIKPTLPRLSEESFEELVIEVMMASRLYCPDALLHAVRNSISNSSSNMRRVLPIVRTKASTKEILEKLENIYGDRRPGESHLAEFYRAKQGPDENVADWRVRIENIIQMAVKKGQKDAHQTDAMLCKRFWKYLYNEKLKLSTRLFYESCKSFEELRKHVRIEESEMNIDTESMISQATKESKANLNKISTVDEQLHILRDLVRRMDRLKHDLVESRSQHRNGNTPGGDDRTNRSDNWRDHWRRSGNQGHDNYRRYDESAPRGQ